MDDSVYNDMFGDPYGVDDTGSIAETAISDDGSDTISPYDTRIGFTNTGSGTYQDASGTQWIIMNTSDIVNPSVEHKVYDDGMSLVRSSDVASAMTAPDAVNAANSYDGSGFFDEGDLPTMTSYSGPPADAPTVADSVATLPTYRVTGDGSTYQDSSGKDYSLVNSSAIQNANVPRINFGNGTSLIPKVYSAVAAKPAAYTGVLGAKPALSTTTIMLIAGAAGLALLLLSKKS